jgi:small neutral amino acid transporter SnatA (MarC family)
MPISEGFMEGISDAFGTGINLLMNIANPLGIVLIIFGVLGLFPRNRRVGSSMVLIIFGILILTLSNNFGSREDQIFNKDGGISF